jgi:hypothetical protein
VRTSGRATGRVARHGRSGRDVDPMHGQLVVGPTKNYARRHCAAPPVPP